MKYIVIGLGNYGAALVEGLTAMGHEVIGVDANEQNVERLKDRMVTSFVLNVTDEAALTALPLTTVDIVIVAIGEDFGASVRVVALLKKNKVKHIFARAVDDVHKDVLEAFSLDRILMPEKDAAGMLVQSLSLDARITPFCIDRDHYVFQFAVPDQLVGYPINDLEVNRKFGLKLIALKRGRRVVNSLGFSVLEQQVENTFPDNYELQPDDVLVGYGSYSQFMDFWESCR
ncbi:MAG: TrkA family potassium uptake protein [Phocaeicola plebeius]|nr:TrkA family potassium uptake protein [Phocaeicola plebeius]